MTTIAIGGPFGSPFVFLGMNIVGGMACMVDRWPQSFEVMLSIKGQVNTLHVALNGFTRVPPEIAQEDWIIPWHVGHNMGDLGKFADVECDAYLSLDDDLIYPETYVEDFLKSSESYPNTVLTHHGNDCKGPTNSYFKMRYANERIQCLMKNDKDMILTIPGTGCTFFPGEIYSEFYSLLFDGWNHADLIAGKVLRDMGTPIRSVKHPKRYFEYLIPPVGTTIWDMTVQQDKKMTDIWNKIGL